MSSLIASLTLLLVLAVTSVSQGFITADDVTRALDALPLSTIIQAWPRKYTGCC